MPYIPHTEEDTQAMLRAIGAKRIEDFFVEIPESLRLTSELDIPGALDEYAIGKSLAAIGAKNRARFSKIFSRKKSRNFLGADQLCEFFVAACNETGSRPFYL